MISHPIPFACALLAAAAGPQAQLADPTIQSHPSAQSSVSRAGGSAVIGIQCNLIDFEGIGDQAAIGTIVGSPNVSFGASWMALVDADAGGSGNFANEPSPDTVAFFLDPAEPIDFDLGVQYVELFYSASAASLPVVLTAWDGPAGTGNVVDVAMGNTIGQDLDGAPCTGDPNGPFCLWDRIVLTAASDVIVSITLEGAVANEFAFDNMLFCTDVPCSVPPSTTVVPDPGGFNANDALTGVGDPTLGNVFYGMNMDDPTGACGITPGAQAFVVLSRFPASAMVPGFGCLPGDPGEVMVAPPITMLLGPSSWAGPGSPTFFPVPLPQGAGLCNFNCFSQGFWFDPTAASGPYIVTNRLEVVIGL